MQHKFTPKEWIKAGGMLGMAILAARATKTPLATIIAAMPILLKHLRQAESEQAAQGGGKVQLTRAEAALILGVAVSANEQEVREAHRRLIQKNHPDVGGTDYLAAKINQARDVMLTK